ncbi:casein kinase substrate phosphoprotein PP28-domain-containing protein [Chaetomium sp. MPI-SDFR-AT-0129]|nr:casein kinase substrate phosphoprotein PP28-domain-containing protein [Chaetomium sp. MPI-SDFR-AT-0129]
MAGGGPGANSRGRGGKFKKYTRGGGKHFSRDLRPLDADGNEISMWSQDARKKGGSDDDDDDDDDSDEEEDSDEEDSDDAAAGASQSAAAAELSREERKKEKKARKEAAIARSKKPVEVGDLPPSDSEEDDDDEDDDDMPANPNHSRKARNQTKAPAPGADDVDAATEGVKKLNVAPSRKEREAMEAAAAKERYRKLHEAGKTDEARADLARLKLIREKREQEAARKQVCCSVVFLGCG